MVSCLGVGYVSSPGWPSAKLNWGKNRVLRHPWPRNSSLCDIYTFRFSPPETSRTWYPSSHLEKRSTTKKAGVDLVDPADEASICANTFYATNCERCKSVSYRLITTVNLPNITNVRESRYTKYGNVLHRVRSRRKKRNNTEYIMR